MAATAIVLMTCAAVTTVTVTAARAGGRAQLSAAADSALLAEAARLRSLPFFVPLPSDWPARRQAPVPSAVGELYPHADVALNAEDSRIFIDGPRAGAFETSVTVQGRTVRRTVCMARCEAVGMASCALWRPSRGGMPGTRVRVPGEALLVRLEAVRGQGEPGDGESGTRVLTFVLTAEGRPRSVRPCGAGRRGRVVGCREAADAGQWRILGRRPRRELGFSLVELLIAASLAGVMLAASWGWLWTTASAARGADARAQDATAQAFGARMLRADLARAVALGAPDQGICGTTRLTLLARDPRTGVDEVVAVAWDPRRGVVWRKASGLVSRRGRDVVRGAVLRP